MKVRVICLILTGFLLVGLYACRDNEYIPVADQDKEVTITFSVPQVSLTKAPDAYSMPEDEATVNTIDVLVFKTDPAFPNDPSKGTFFYRTIVGHTQGSASFTTHLSESSDNQTIVVLANCRTAVGDLMQTIRVGDTKASVIHALTLRSSVAFDPATMGGIPMWGEITDQPVTASYNPVGLTVQLTRMLAKINIANNDSSNFTLLEAYLYNPRQQGSVIPDNWNGTNAVTTPTLVAGSEMAQGTRFGSFTTSATNRIDHKIYTFEADNAVKAAAGLPDATCIVVGGNYRGSTKVGYYRIDLKNYATGTFFNILRNHQYDISVISVDGEGSDSPGDAFTGVSKINANVEIWNQATGDVQYGNSHLYVSQRYPWLKQDGITEPYAGSKLLKVMTNDPAGWKWKDDPTTQATLNDFGVTTTGGEANVEVTVQWGKSTNTNNVTGLEGKAILVAGNLEYTVVFILDDSGRMGMGSTQQIGEHFYLTYCYPTGDNGAMECWMVENSMEGIYSGKGYGLDVDGNTYGNIPDGLYFAKVNGYYYTYDQAALPNNACPDGWSLPTKSQCSLLVEAVNNDLNNSGRWWAGPYGGANKAFAGGYFQYNDAPIGDWMFFYVAGYWWLSSLNGHECYCSFTNEMYNIFPEVSRLSWITVRCVKN